MKKIFERNETLFCILLIVAYILINSYCVNNFGIGDYRSAIINTIFSLSLIILIKILKRTTYYGLTKVTNIKKYLYFFPLLLLITVNLWNGININNSVNEIIFHIINMINVGFIEEIIFRGFLFTSLSKNSVNTAILVSSVTFGMGHIVNLINGSGANVFSNLLQVVYATAVGFLFTIIFYKSKSLWPCIITHSLVNALSAISNNGILNSSVEIIITYNSKFMEWY